MRDDDQRPAMRDPRNVGVHDRFAFGIERAGGFVKNKNGRIDDQRPRDRQPLPLAAR